MTCQHKHNISKTFKGIGKASQRSFFETLHRIADGLAPKVKRAFISAVDELRSTSSLKSVQDAVETGNVEAVIEALGMQGFGRQLEPMAEELQSVFQQAAQASTANIPKNIAVQMRFDLINQRSVQFLRRYKLGLIRQIDSKTREGVRSVVLDAFEQGGHPRVQAQKIRQFIGLTRNQSKAVDNFRQMLVDEGRDAAQVSRMTEKYFQRQLKRRATNIARTETIRAANEGQQELWRQASDDGLIDLRTAKRKFIVTPDDRLCRICRPIPGMNPKGVGINEMFNTPVGPKTGPPIHPSCRCATALIKF